MLELELDPKRQPHLHQIQTDDEDGARVRAAALCRASATTKPSVRNQGSNSIVEYAKAGAGPAISAVSESLSTGAACKPIGALQARILRESDARVLAVAQAVRYDSAASFSRAFKRLVGQPAAPRRRGLRLVSRLIDAPEDHWHLAGIARFTSPVGPTDGRCKPA